MSSTSRINEQGHLAPGEIDLNDPATRAKIDGAHEDNLKLRDAAGPQVAQAAEPVSTDPMAWNTLHDMLDMLLEGDTEGAMRASAKLTLHEIRRYADATDELRTILTARIAVRYMEMQPEIKSLLQQYMPHLVAMGPTGHADPSAP